MTEKAEITYKDVELTVEFEYCPAEPVVMYFKDGSGDPGCDACCEIQEIFEGGVDVWEKYKDKLEFIEDEIFEQIIYKT
jgi:hypothetical protein